MEVGPLARELEVAQSLARRAAHVVMAHYATDFSVDYKNGDRGNPVTAADREANAIIVAGLSEAFPQDAILAEESADSVARHGVARLWCVDPIDGTREFVARNGQFVVMIGLAIDGEARLGVLFEPTEDRLIWGVGDTAFAERRGETRALRVSNCDNPSRATLMVSRSHHSRSVEEAATTLGVGHKKPMGSVGLKLYELASGGADVYISTSNQTHEWDACAPEAIVRAAGGRVTDICGRPLRYNTTTKTNTPYGIVASNGHLHAACLAAVAPFARQRGWLT